MAIFHGYVCLPEGIFKTHHQLSMTVNDCPVGPLPNIDNITRYGFNVQPRVAVRTLKTYPPLVTAGRKDKQFPRRSGQMEPGRKRQGKAKHWRKSGVFKVQNPHQHIYCIVRIYRIYSIPHLKSWPVLT